MITEENYSKDFNNGLNFFSLGSLNHLVIQDFKCFCRIYFVQGLFDSDFDVTDFKKLFNVKDGIFVIPLAW